MTHRLAVLTVFKDLHRTRQKVFQGDSYALSAARDKINLEFRKNVEEKDDEKIQTLIKVASDSEMLLRKTVAQAVKTDENTYQVKVRPDIVLGENTLFDPFAEIPIRKSRKKCSDSDNPT